MRGMSEFTQWEYVRQTHCDNGWPYATTYFVKVREELIEIGSESGYDNNSVTEQRARLIAAAPTMYAAIEHALTDPRRDPETGMYCIDEDAINTLWAAFRAARGEQKEADAG